MVHERACKMEKIRRRKRIIWFWYGDTQKHVHPLQEHKHVFRTRIYHTNTLFGFRKRFFFSSFKFVRNLPAIRSVYTYLLSFVILLLLLLLVTGVVELMDSSIWKKSLPGNLKKNSRNPEMLGGMVLNKYNHILIKSLQFFL